MGSANGGVLERHADKIARAEEILGYEFEDKPLLGAALTHPSALDKERNLHDYERLEFLGDSILGAITASFLFDEYKDLTEGGLTRIKVSLVSGDSLSEKALNAGIADCIIFGDSETGTDRRGLASALENVYEALVAALYLDGGIEAARKWVTDSLLVHADASMALEPESSKSSLQEYLQNIGMQPEYEITGFDGPPHARTFHAQVSVDSELLGRGSGHSKKKAEMAAASDALEHLAQRPEHEVS